MKFPRPTRMLPNWKNAALAVLSAILLVLAFPDFDYWFLAWFALVPLFWAIGRERESTAPSFILGWLWGFIFFTGTCWWLTFAPITYAAFPPWLAYLLLFAVTAAVGIFPGIFAGIMSLLIRRFGEWAILASPFVWVFTEFLRYWLSGNNWNAIGYSQFTNEKFLSYAAYGGVELAGFIVLTLNVVYGYFLFVVLRSYGRTLKQLAGNITKVSKNESATFIEPDYDPKKEAILQRSVYVWLALVILASIWSLFFAADTTPRHADDTTPVASIVAIQPNVPMSGLTEPTWRQLRARHVELAESALQQLGTDHQLPTTVIFPESPMNFMWEEDEEFRNFVRAFAAKHNVQVLFNSAEPDAPNNKYFNSAVLVGPEGREIAQYDKIYLLPFGESVPSPLQAIIPAFVGSFSYGRKYDLMPIGDAKAGVMICFESHFGELGRQFVRNGADMLIEMTNDGYLGPTPVLRQHLANAVFRAVETNRPVIRVTNVGITAYINERGEIIDPAEPYTDTARVWSVAKSDGKQTFYVRYGDWFAWLCSIVTIGLLIVAFTRPPRESAQAEATLSSPDLHST